MTRDEILQLAQEFCVKNSNKKVGYRVYTGNDQFIDDEAFGGGHDDKLNQEAYFRQSFTVVAQNMGDKSLVARIVFFLIDYDTYKQEFFWRLEEGDRVWVLTKVWLEEYKDLIGDLCITIGYTQFVDDIRFSPDLIYQYKTGADLLGFMKQLVTDARNFVYLAPYGIHDFDEESLAREQITLFPDVDVKAFGTVDPVGEAKCKLAKKLKMHEMDNLYGTDDLGPVFFSKI